MPRQLKITPENLQHALKQRQRFQARLQAAGPADVRARADAEREILYWTDKATRIARGLGRHLDLSRGPEVAEQAAKPIAKPIIPRPYVRPKPSVTVDIWAGCLDD